MAFGGGLGFDVDLCALRLGGAGLAVVAEGGSRLVVEVPAGRLTAFERTLRGSSFARLGSVTDADGLLRWGSREVGRLGLARLYERWRSSLVLP